MSCCGICYFSVVCFNWMIYLLTDYLYYFCFSPFVFLRLQIYLPVVLFLLSSPWLQVFPSPFFSLVYLASPSYAWRRTIRSGWEVKGENPRVVELKMYTKPCDAYSERNLFCQCGRNSRTSSRAQLFLPFLI